MLQAESDETPRRYYVDFTNYMNALSYLQAQSEDRVEAIPQTVRVGPKAKQYFKASSDERKAVKAAHKSAERIGFEVCGATQTIAWPL